MLMGHRFWLCTLGHNAVSGAWTVAQDLVLRAMGRSEGFAYELLGNNTKPVTRAQKYTTVI